MTDEPIHPGSGGVEAATKKLREHLDALLAQQHRETQALLMQQHRETHAAIRRIEKALADLERQLNSMGTQIQDLDAKLDNVANLETQMGIDIQVVVDWFKANPNPTPTDLTAQLAKVDAIAQKLIDTSASTLGNLPPTPPPPVPARRK